VRPEVFFTKYISLAFESGFDHTEGFATTQNGNTQFSGWLRKFTIAPQIGAGRQFFSRPVLRLFATYANWSNGYRGFVGRNPIPGQKQRAYFRSAGGNVVVGNRLRQTRVRKAHSVLGAIQSAALKIFRNLR